MAMASLSSGRQEVQGRRRARRRGARFVAAVAGVALVATACGGGASSAGKTSSASKPSSGGSLVSVTMGIAPGAASLGEYVAQEKGIFAKNGLNATFTPELNITIVPAALITGALQFGITVQPILLQAAAKGLPLVATAGGQVISAKSLNDAVIVPKGSGITGPAGLVGPRIGVPTATGNFTDCLLYWMHSHGVNYKAANLAVVPFPDMQAQLAAGTIQAALPVAPYWNAMVKAGNISLGDPCLSVAPVSLGSFLASDSTWARAHSNIVKAVQTSLTEANTYIQAHPVQARQILAQASGLNASATQGLPLQLYTGTEPVSDLRNWVHVLTVLGLSPGTLNLAQLVFPPQTKS